MGCIFVWKYSKVARNFSYHYFLLQYSCNWQLIPIKNLVRALKKDKDYREGWKANIAMSFKDNYSWHKDKTGKRSMSKEDLHIISNDAAEYFLKLLCNELKFPKGR